MCVHHYWNEHDNIPLILYWLLIYQHVPVVCDQWCWMHYIKRGMIDSYHGKQYHGIKGLNSSSAIVSRDIPMQKHMATAGF